MSETATHPIDISEPFTLAYAVRHGNRGKGHVILVKYGEEGYYSTNIPELDTMEDARQMVRELNQKLGIDDKVADSMSFASMFGWDKPCAMLAHRYFAAKA